MRKHILLSGLALTSHLLAQGPSEPARGLRAEEVGALRHLRTWLAGPPNQHVPLQSRTLGYEAPVFGFDRGGKPVRGQANRIDPEATSVMLMLPRGDALWPARLLYGNRAGRIFVGERPIDAGADWQPTVATFSGPGVDVHLNNMLLQSGTAVDGTRWQRIDDLPELTERPFRVRLHSRDDARFAAGRVEIGGSPFLWHPSWVSVDDARVVSFHAMTKPGDAAEVELQDRGVPATGMRLFVPGLRLSAANVSYGDGVLVVTYGREDRADASWLDDQAWAVHGLRLFAAAQQQARREGRIDRDSDGRGEFGLPDEVMPANQRLYETRKDGTYRVRNHLIAVHVPADPDGAEQRFVATAWPETAHDAGDLAFTIDATGAVRMCPAVGRYVGHGAEPAADASAQPAPAWRLLR